MDNQHLRSDEALTLAILLEAGEPLSAMDIGYATGKYRNGSPSTWADLGRHLVTRLTTAGAVTKHGRKPMRFDITDRGRLALALFVGQRLRKSSGTPRNRPPGCGS